jgi:hypothetical protein
MTVEQLEDRVVPSAVLLGDRPTATLVADKADYHPGSTAVLSLSGFAVGEAVRLQVTSAAQGPGQAPWVVVDGGPGDLDGKPDGHITTTWAVDPHGAYINATLFASATGLTAGETASATFTDSAISSTPQGGNWSSVLTWSPTARTGTITTSASSRAVTGTGTLFTSELTVGTRITTALNQLIGVVASITDNTHLTLVANAATTNTNVSYRAQVVPGAGDSVTIVAGSNVTVDTAAAAASTVTVGGNPGNQADGTKTAYLTFAAGSQLTTGTAITVGSGTYVGVLDMTGGGTLKVAGTLTITTGKGTFTAGTGTVDFSGAGNQSINPLAYYNLSGSTGGTKTVTSGTSVAGNLGVNAATVDFSTNNVSLAVNSVSMTGGSITTGGATLTLNGDLTTNAASSAATISGNLSLGSSARTFNVAAGSGAQDLVVSAVISGLGGLSKAGPGTAALTALNTYTGPTTLTAGLLTANTLLPGGSPSSLGASGSAAANLVFNGGTLQYTGPTTTSDRSYTLGSNGGVLDASGTGALTVSGNMTAAGAGASQTLTLTGTSTAANSLSGATANGPGSNVTTLTKSGTGTWVLGGTGANTHSGPTTVNAGILQFNKPSGVNAFGGDLVVGDGVGTDTAQLLAPNQIPDTSTVTLSTSGVLALGSYNDTVGSLLGYGSETGTGTLTVASNLSPGFNGPGSLSTGPLTLGPGATYTIQLMSPTAGSGYDQTNVTGTATLNSSSTVNVSQVGYLSAVGDMFAILKATNVSGTFAGGAGAIVTAPNGMRFQLSYTGTEVDLTHINTAPTLANIETSTLGYKQNDPPTQVTNTITISDPEDLFLVGATVAITSGFTPGQDVLGFTPIGGITGSYNGTTGVLTLSGTDTLADYQAALQSVSYFNSSNFPSTVNRVITFQVNDGHSASNLSNTQSRTVSITLTNVPPVVTADYPAVSAAEGVAATNTGTFSDLDPTTVAITASTGSVSQVGSQNGTWSWSGTGDAQNPYSVTITATAADGGVSSTSFSVSFTDVVPTATFANNGPITYGQAATVTFSNPYVPSSTDTAAGFHYAYSTSLAGLSGATYATAGSSPTFNFTGLKAGTQTVYGEIIAVDNGSTVYSTQVTVNPKTLTGSITASNKIYNGTTTATITSRTLSGVLPGDVVSYVGGTATFSDKNVGSGKTVTATGLSLSGLDAFNYTVNTTATTTANITVRGLSLTATGVNKAYDGTTTATVTLIDNRIVGDVLTDSYASASFADKNVGTGKAVSVSGISISGPDAPNYTLLSTTASTTANITPLALTVTATGVDKVYDGTTAAAVTLSDSRIAGDVFTDSYTTANFADKNVGTNKPVSVNGISISGPDAGNYTFNTTASTTANITARALTVSATVVSKVYDGTTAATVTLSDNRIAGDVLTASYGSASFADKNVGTGKAVSVSGISVSGADAGNYALQNDTANTTADITARTLTVTAAGVNKVYDGTTVATVTLSDDRIAGDLLTDSYASAAFADKYIGTNKLVTVSGISISGPAAGNYALQSTTATTTADITAHLLTVTATGVSKVYDGTTSATVTLFDNRQSGDVLTVTYASASFADKNVGTNKAVTVSGISISGPDAGNYALQSTTAAATADIAPLTLAVTATGINKVYDGTTAATVTLSDNRIAGDSLTDSYASANFADKNVGTAKAVSVSGISISGADSGNYSLQNTTASTTANIAPLGLTVTATGVSKTYDGTTAATVTLSDNRVAGDSLTDSYASAAFADRNVGTGKSVSVSGISISGADSGNYSLQDTTATTTADITPLALTVTATGVSKVYDGTTAAAVMLSDNRIAGDSLTDSYSSASFADKNVGTGKSVAVTGITISGADSGNYSLQNTTATTTADITPLALTVTATGVSKVYDGTTAAAVTLSDNRIAGDSFTDSYSSASFADKNVGTGKSVSVSGISISGADAGNYTFNTTASTTADITARSLTVTAAGLSKVYDGTTAAAVTLSDNRIAGDSLTDSYTSATFSDRNVGTGKGVSVSGISISGADSGNYSLQNTTATTTADITPLALTVTATGVSKVYDGTTAAAVTLSDNRITGDSLTDSYSSASFADKNVGTGKSVSVSGISITGGDSGNYSLQNTTASTTANITPLALTVTAAGVNKVYDGTAAGTVTLSDNRIAGDSLTDSYTSASFSDKNVGTNKAVSVTGIAISGTDAGNYTLQNTTASTTANITARSLTVTFTAANKVYDATTTATVTLQGDNRIAGDVFTVTYGSASFSDKNVGTGKTVTVTGISLSGTDAGNYTVNSPTTTTADITPRTLNVTATGVNKVYDGTATATVILTDDRIAGDVFTDTYASAIFANGKNVGNNRPIHVNGIGVSGPDAGNYTLANTTYDTKANITLRTLTVTASAANKTYDGTTAATVTLSDNRIAGDSFTVNYTSATFTDKNVGTAKTVTAAGISIGNGSAATNYQLGNTTATTTADITPLSLTVTATGVNKTYDGTTAATVTLADNRIAGDVLTDNYTTATFANKNVGTGKTVTGSGITISGTDAGNYSLSNTTASTTANITAKALTVSASGVNKTYDGTTTATVTLSDNCIAGDVLTDNYTTATFANKNVGTGKTVTVSGISISGTDAGNYTANTTATTTANITAKSLTVTATGVNKIYDGTTAATVTLADNRIAGDVLTDSYTTATFPNKNVGTGKTVTVSGISISGTDAGNYTANTTATTTANITAKSLTVTAAGVNKTYDGTTAATVTLSDNRIAGDVLTDSYTTATFPNKNVGTGKTVSVSGISVSGTDVGNYSLSNTTASTTANITAKAMTVSATGVNKTYDGTTAATVTLADNRIAGDVLTDSYTTATFSDKNVGTGKTVTVGGISISGTDAGNYTANTTASATANIAAKSLTVTAAGVNKTYDGTTTATVTLADNRIAGDVLTDAYTSATFSDKNVGTGKTVTVSGISISGTDAGNYTANTTATTTANITAKSLTVTATGVNKIYDGTTAATVTLADNRIAGDVLTDSYTTATFPNKNVGTGKTVNVSGITISGADAGNYSLSNTTASTTANITAKALTVSATGVNKTYDGTTAATVTLADNRIAGDVLTDSYTTATFADKNVGTAKTVSVSGISVSGTDAGNYSLPGTTASTTANITARSLTVSATGVNKTYDGTTAATVTLSDNRIAGDVLTDAYTNATFSDKSVGTAKTISVNGISISGADAGNYTANSTATTTANITTRSLTATATGVSKTYDGTTTATLAFNDNRIAGDVFTYSYTAAFSDKNVGTAKTVSISGVSISGTDASNYTLQSTTSSTTADITARSLTVSATGVNKTYDATTAATVTLSDNRIAGDSLTDAYTSAAFSDKNVGTGKTVSVSGISISGTDAGNYTANTTASTTANITARSLTVSATGVSKTYDATTAATVTLSDNRIAGDSLTDAYTSAAFSDKNVGTGKTVSVSGISISGTDAGNYTTNSTTSTTANITAKSLTITAAGVNKIYDGTTAATVTLSDNRVSGDSLTDSYTSATFADASVGTSKTVTVSGISISGTDAGNYTANSTATATADITPFVFGFGSTGSDAGYSVTLDSSGYLYVAGSFQGTVNFDPNGGTTYLTSAGSDDIFVAKYNATTRALVWAKRMGGTGSDVANAIAVDSSGNVYTTGYFNGTANFNPNGTNNLTSAGGTDIFVSKLDSTGAYVWADDIGGTGADAGNAIAVDSSGNVYTTGYYTGTVNFNPNTGKKQNLTSAGGTDIFVSKLDSTGAYVGAWSMGGSGSDAGAGIALDGSGNILTTGYFSGTANFNPSGTNNLTSAGNTDIFVSKLSSTGAFVWADRMGGTSADSAKGIALDSSGNVYTTGYFAGTANFNPNGTNILTSAGGNDAFVSKLTSAGAFGWADDLGGSGNDAGNAIAVDSSGNVYTTGYFSGTANFNPGGTYNLTSAGNTDIFVSKLSSAGAFVWADGMGGTGADIGNGLALSGTSYVHLTGSFSGTANFNPSGTYNVTAAATTDGFVARLTGAAAMAQRLAPGAATGTMAGQALTSAALQPIVAEAIANWAAVGLDAHYVQLMRQVSVQVTDLPAGYLGMAYPNVIQLDRTAAGVGWYIGATPADNSEFRTLLPGKELVALGGSPAFGKVDLLTVVEHELGHLFGFNESPDATSVMAEYLGTGVRKLPTTADVPLVLGLPAGIGNNLPTAANGPVTSTSSDARQPSATPTAIAGQPLDHGSVRAGAVRGGGSPSGADAGQFLGVQGQDLVFQGSPADHVPGQGQSLAGVDFAAYGPRDAALAAVLRVWGEVEAAFVKAGDPAGDASVADAVFAANLGWPRG